MAKTLENFASMFENLPDMRQRAAERVAEIKEVLEEQVPAPKPKRKEVTPRRAGTAVQMSSADIESMERNGTKFPSWMKPTHQVPISTPTIDDGHVDPVDTVDTEPATSCKDVLKARDMRKAPVKAQVPIDLYPPSRCTDSLPPDLELDFLVGEEKLDGGRYMLYLDCDPYNRCRGGHTVLSRHPSATDGNLVDKTDRVPHISGVDYPGLEGTVLDGEMMREGATCLGDTSGILNSDADEAVRRQESEGMIEFHTFDILAHQGKYVGSLPLEDRRVLLEKVVTQMGNPHVMVTEQRPATAHDLNDYFYEVVSRGGEGLVIKDKRMSYGVGWSKMKKAYDVSLIVTGFKPGKGKYANQFGALALSVWHKGKMVEVAYASGMDDALRTEINDNRPIYMGTVVDVFTQELTAPSAAAPCGRLRHATFFRLRDDVVPDTVTYDKLVADLANINKVRPIRAK